MGDEFYSQRYVLPPLCHQCRLTKSAPLLWKAEALQRASEPGYFVSIACTQSEHFKARPEVAPQATEDRSVRSFLNLFGPILRALPGSFLGKEPALRDFLPAEISTIFYFLFSIFYLLSSTPYPFLTTVSWSLVPSGR